MGTQKFHEPTMCQNPLQNPPSHIQSSDPISNPGPSSNTDPGHATSSPQTLNTEPASPPSPPHPLHLLSPRTLPLYHFLPLHHNLLNSLTHPRHLYHHQISLPLHLHPLFTHTSSSHLQTHPTALLPTHKLPVKHLPLSQLPIQLPLLHTQKLLQRPQR